MTHCVLRCPLLGVSIHCQLPAELQRLAGVMLSGWQLVACAAGPAEIVVDKPAGQAYTLEAEDIHFTAKHKDLVSTFNELLIAIAYLTCKHNRQWRLLHGGAMIVEGNKQIYLGGHKAGKSSYLARHCHANGILVSDDLLLVNEQEQIAGLGFPLRLRRPVAEDIIQLYSASNLLAGHSLVYLGPKALPLHPAGKAFYADDCYLLEDYQAVSMPPLRWPELIKQRLINIPSS